MVPTLLRYRIAVPHPHRRLARSRRAGRGLYPGLLSLLLAAACAGQSATRSIGPDPTADTSERIERVQNNLLTYNVVRGEAPHTIEDRLRFYRVPGVSIAVVDSGRIVWAHGWGEVQAGSGVSVDSSTLFQAASISKPVAAAGALRLVERGALSLDEDVNTRLRSWRVPASRYTDSAKVTVRRLLSHSAGTTVDGFPGYTVGAQVPSPIQILTGTPPANTTPVVVDTFPGSEFRYSGGGYVIVQLLMTDVTGQPFPALMRELVLSPARMAQSTFVQTPSAELDGQIATAHDQHGVRVPGRHHIYPEMSAAGMWSTPSDLMRFALSVQQSLAGDSGALLSPEIAQLMIERQADDYGLGFSVEGSADSLWFSHGGSNAGFEAYLIASVTGGRGAAVMTNGDGGRELAIEILRSIAREYDWGIFQPNERAVVEVHPSTLAVLTGTYRADLPGEPGSLVIEVRLHDRRLRVDIPYLDWHDRSLRAATPSRFFFLESPGVLEFERNTDGSVTSVVMTGLGEPVRAVRVDE